MSGRVTRDAIAMPTNGIATIRPASDSATPICSTNRVSNTGFIALKRVDML